MSGDLPVEGRVEVELPVGELWSAFADVARWPRWNPCIRWARVGGGQLRPGATLVWAFNPVRAFYPYLLPAVATLVEVEPERRVTWEVERVPGFSARHSYLFERLGPHRSRFGSWEVAEGPLYRLLRPFWLAHFRYVCRTSLAGARALERRRRGVRLLRYGAPSPAPPLVVVPGIDGSPGSVAPLIELLAAHRQVVLADYTAEDHPSLDGLAGEVADRVAAELTGPLDVLGQSIGTVVAAQVATRLAGAVRRVVLVAPFTRGRWRLLGLAAAGIRRTPRWLYRLTTPGLLKVVCGPVGDGRGHPFFERSRLSDPVAVARRTAWQVGRDFSPDLRAVEQPTLVLLGAEDRFVPDAAAELERLRTVLADRPATVRSLPAAGHVLLPATAVAAAAEAVEGFLAP